MAPPIWPDTDRFNQVDADHVSVLANIATLGPTTRLGSIRSLLRGTMILSPDSETSKTASFAAVTMARTQVFSKGGRWSASVPDGDNRGYHATLVLTNTTTITLQIGGSTTTSFQITEAYEVLEFNA
jgi:hypothetical protein